MRHSKPAQLETAPTKHGDESVYLFLEFTINQDLEFIIKKALIRKSTPFFMFSELVVLYLTNGRADRQLKEVVVFTSVCSRSRCDIFASSKWPTALSNWSRPPGLQNPTT